MLHGIPITAHINVYWGFMSEAVQLIYPHVDHINIQFGPTKLVHDNGLLIDDGSLDAVRSLPDPMCKIQVTEREQWDDKLQMSKLATNHISNLFGNYKNWHLELGGDELFFNFEHFLKNAPKQGSPAWINYYGDNNHWIHDKDASVKRYGAKIANDISTCIHYRWSLWEEGTKYIHHTDVRDRNNRSKHNSPEVAGMVAHNVFPSQIYHFGGILHPAVMKAKHKFYQLRDKTTARAQNEEDAYKKWNGKAEETKDGIVEKTFFQMPTEVGDAYERYMVRANNYLGGSK
jgi:hypothetical protein